MVRSGGASRAGGCLVSPGRCADGTSSSHAGAQLSGNGVHQAVNDDPPFLHDGAVRRLDSRGFNLIGHRCPIELETPPQSSPGIDLA